MTDPDSFVVENRAVRGYLHKPEGSPRGFAVLAHGAGSDARSPVLVAAAGALAARGLAVFRCDLPFRQRRPSGPPQAGDAARDREGLRAAVEEVRRHCGGMCVLGGHSYGGRMASMLAAEDPTIAEVLLLSSYPLHPPGKPAALRTAHFPRLRTPAVFVQGSKDPFGTLAEMDAALALIPAAKLLVAVEGAGHDLWRGRKLTEAMEQAGAALDQLLLPTSAPTRSPGVE